MGNISSRQGSNHSHTIDNYSKYDDSSMYHPFETPTMLEAGDNDILNNPGTIEAQNKILRTPFTSKWSILFPDSLSPCCRVGHFTVEDPINNCCYIGYGCSEDQTMLNDLWCFDLNIYKWKHIKLSGNIASPRSGLVACDSGSHIVVFGGYNGLRYYNNLYTIHKSTWVMEEVQTSGSMPSPRSTPIMQIVGGKLYLWGGFNGDWDTVLYVLDIVQRKWVSYPQSVPGRTSAPSVIYGTNIVSYGGSNQSGVLVIDTINNVVRVDKTKGIEPPKGLMSSSMVLIGDYGLYFGGKSEKSHMYIYIINLKIMIWSLFYVVPDEVTTFVGDGYVSQYGLFMLPCVHSMSICRDHVRRRIVGFLGCPYAQPSPILIIDTSEASTTLNLRIDMIEMFKRQ